MIFTFSYTDWFGFGWTPTDKWLKKKDQKAQFSFCYYHTAEHLVPNKRYHHLKTWNVKSDSPLVRLPSFGDNVWDIYIMAQNKSSLFLAHVTIMRRWTDPGGRSQKFNSKTLASRSSVIFNMWYSIYPFFSIQQNWFDESEEKFILVIGSVRQVPGYNEKIMGPRTCALRNKL